MPGVVDAFSLVAPRGQITCIAGQVGAGAAAVIRALAGLVPGASREHYVGWRTAAAGIRASSRLQRNIIFVSEDRGREGFFRRNVLENLVAAQMPELHVGPACYPGASCGALGEEIMQSSCARS